MNKHSIFNGCKSILRFLRRHWAPLSFTVNLVLLVHTEHKQGFFLAVEQLVVDAITCNLEKLYLVDHLEHLRFFLCILRYVIVSFLWNGGHHDHTWSGLTLKTVLVDNRVQGFLGWVILKTWVWNLWNVSEPCFNGWFRNILVCTSFIMRRPSKR